MISAIRTYVKDRVTEEDATFSEISEAFDEDRMGKSNTSKTFHITYELTGNDEENGCLLIESGVGVLTMYFNGSVNKNQSIYDTAMDTSHNIKLRIANPKNWGNNIKRVQSTSLSPERLGNNANIVKITMNFEFTLAYQVKG